MTEEKSDIGPDLPVQATEASLKTAGPEPRAGRVQSHEEKDSAATRKELYSYYAYYAGNNGIGSFQ